MRFLPANAQHIGSRHSQQDWFGFGDPDNRDFVAHGGFLAVVCDGMGGMEFGDAASKAATRAFLDAYQEKTPAETIPAALERSVRIANTAVLTLATSYGLSEGMGTTLVAAAFHDSAMHYISVGDSGLFLLRAGNLQTVNHPHVFANLLDAAVARGTLSAADAETHPERESLTSFIGTENLEEIDASAEPIPLLPGDAVLLASDGLFKTLSNGEMLACMNGNPLSWPDALVTQTIAKKREHQDNVTVLSVTVESEVTPDGTTIRRPSPPVAAPAPVVAAPVPIPAAPVATPVLAFTPVAPAAAPVAVPPVTAPPITAAPRSHTPLLTVLTILLIIAVSAAVYLYRHRAPSGLHPASETDGAVAAPPLAPGAKPVDIRPDPDAPMVRPVTPPSTRPAPKGSPQ